MPNSTVIKAGIVIKSRFLSPKSKQFATYIDYINRDEAVRNEKFEQYSAYNDYMDNSEKSGALFTAELDFLNEQQNRALKQSFRLAQKRGSLMWQNVISFDNRFLQKHGAYDPKTKWLDEAKMRDLTRSAMAELLSQNGMSESALWSASIHYNTDNIHIHAAVVEPVPTRKRGKLLPKSLLSAKSKAAAAILDRTPQQERIQELVREQILQSKCQHHSMQDKKLRGMFRQLYQQLPQNHKKWFYNDSTIDRLRPQIDAFTTEYIQQNHAKEFEELKGLLRQEQEIYREAYGGSEYDRYMENKLQDLYTRMGNTVLKELRKYHREMEQRTRANRQRKQQSVPAALYTAIAINASIKRLEHSLSDDVQKYRNQIEYEQLRQQIDYER